jgi:hypothetical protein
LDSSSVVHDSAAKLCRAIRWHAQLCEVDPRDSTAIETAAAAVNSAVTDYAYDVFRKEGFDIFFAEPPEDPEDQEEEEGLTRITGSGTDEFIIDDRYVIHVEDSSALVNFAEAATNRRPQDSADALRILCGKDGWSVLAYPEGMITVNYHAVDTA